MEYDLEMNAFQTAGPGTRRRTHGAAFSSPGYCDEEGGARLYKRRCGAGDAVSMLGGGGPPPQAFQMLQVHDEYIDRRKE